MPWRRILKIGRVSQNVLKQWGNDGGVKQEVGSIYYVSCSSQNGVWKTPSESWNWEMTDMNILESCFAKAGSVSHFTI